MKHAETFSDRELDRRIVLVRRDLAKVRPGGWTHGKLAESLAHLVAQRALPREARARFTTGSL